MPRHRSLAEAAAALGIAERQGIGVARMTRDLLAMGRPRPQIYEIAGPYVRVTLLGGEPDPAMVRLVSDITPQGLAEAVDTLLLIDELCRRGWVDADAGAAVLQRPAAEVADVISRLGAARLGDEQDAYCRRPAELIPGVIAEVAGVPNSQDPAYCLSGESRHRIGHRCASGSILAEGQNELLLEWARRRGTGVQHRGGGPDRRKRPDRRPPARRARCRRAACAVSAQRHRPRLPLPASARLGDVRVGRSGKSGLRGTVPQSIAAETLARAGLEAVDGLDSAAVPALRFWAPGRSLSPVRCSPRPTRWTAMRVSEYDSARKFDAS